MVSLQDQTSPQAPTGILYSSQSSKCLIKGSTQRPLTWKHWKYDHPDFQRVHDTKISFDGDKILIFGGYTPDQTQKTLNLILVDPESQEFQIIPSVGDDLESFSWSDMSACYWKDSKVIVSGGCDISTGKVFSTVAIVTLTDLDSENPSAHWEKIVTPTELFRASHLAHIYQDKMYIFRGVNENDQPVDDVWCLDLNDFTWSKCDFTGPIPVQQRSSDSRLVFHDKKAYAIPWGFSVDVETINEFDLENMSYQLHKIPNSQMKNSTFDPFPQVIDGKLYFLQITYDRSQGMPPLRQVVAFDLDSQSWIKIRTEFFPHLSIAACHLCCNNFLVLSVSLDNGTPVFGEFWALPLNVPKKTKPPSISVPLSKAQQTMKNFFFEAPYADISFEVETQVIKAHKWWLIQRNKFFGNMFASGMSEAQASTIKITDMKALTFRALLEFLYCDHIELTNNLALDLLQQADKYSVAELKDVCEKYLVVNIEAENYVALGQVSELIGASSLREAVVVFIAKNMKEIKQRKDFNDISDALLRDSLVKFIVK